MKWFTKSKRVKAKRPHKPNRRLPRRELAPVADIVEQGLLVADVAARMNVKNAIIMNALKRHLDYDEAQITEMVRKTLVELADERERDAEHIQVVRGEIRNTGSSAWSESEYGSNDSRTLRHRQEVYEEVAAELRRRADNADYLRLTAERARVAAWAEIGDSLKERAKHPYYSGGDNPEYRKARESRIQLLIQRDLTELMQQHADKSKARATPKPKPGSKREAPALKGGPNARNDGENVAETTKPAKPAKPSWRGFNRRAARGASEETPR